MVAFSGFAVIDALRGWISQASRGAEDGPHAYDHSSGLEMVGALLRSRAVSKGQPRGPTEGHQPLSPDSPSTPSSAGSGR
jgi:hypothetical protein